MIDRLQVRAMRLEMEKRAVSLAGAGRALGRMGALRGAGLGGAAGATLGAGREALKGDDGQPKNYLRAAVRGGLGGAALGGATGAGARHLRDTALLQAASGAKPTAGKVVRGSLSRVGVGLKDFGKRQVHGLTGAYEDSMTSPLKRKIDVLEARNRAGEFGLQPHLPGMAPGVQDVQKELAVRSRAVKSGITSVPGLVKGLVNDPRRTGNALWEQMKGGGGRAGVALGLGLPAAMAVPDIARGDESERGGRTLGQKVVGHSANMGLGFLTGGLPLIPQMLVGEAAQKGIRRVAGPEMGRPV